MTQTNNRFLDELAKLMTDAAGAAQGMRREVETLMKAQGERILRDMDVVQREEFEAVKEMAAKAREENERLARARRRARGGDRGAAPEPEPSATAGCCLQLSPQSIPNFRQLSRLRTPPLRHFGRGQWDALGLQRAASLSLRRTVCGGSTGQGRVASGSNTARSHRVRAKNIEGRNGNRRNEPRRA